MLWNYQRVWVSQQVLFPVGQEGSRKGCGGHGIMGRPGLGAIDKCSSWQECFLGHLTPGVGAVPFPCTINLTGAMILQ